MSNFLRLSAGKPKLDAIVNADISGSAAIAYSKLNLSSSIVNADIASGAAIAYSKLNLSNSIVAGDITANAVTNAKLATMSNMTAKANISGGTATPTDVTIATLATATSLGYRDSNANLGVNNLFLSFATTVSSAGNLNLTQSSAAIQEITGTTTHTVNLPATNSIGVAGFNFQIYNHSTGAVTVKDSGGSTVQVMNGSSQCIVVAKDSGSPGTWSVAYSAYSVTASRAVASDANGLLVASATTSTELGYVSGVTSAIQTQINGKIANTLTTTTGDMIYASSANTPARLAIGSSGTVLMSNGTTPAWTAINYTYNSTGAKQATASSTYLNFLGNGNSVAITTNGVYEIMATVYFNNNGTTPGYTFLNADFYGAAGADNGSTPSGLSNATALWSSGGSVTDNTARTFVVYSGWFNVTGNQTIYCVPFIQCSTPANTRVTVWISAKRIG